MGGNFHVKYAIWSYFINFAQELDNTPEKLAANYLGLSLLAFMIGRFFGTALLRFVAPHTLLTIYGAASAALCAVAVLSEAHMAIWALGATSFFMSIMFPTIFALGIKGLGEHAKIGSSLIVMAIVGGALIPPCMGLFADLAESVQDAIIVPLVCFLVVVAFGRRPILKSALSNQVRKL